MPSFVSVSRKHGAVIQLSKVHAVTFRPFFRRRKIIHWIAGALLVIGVIALLAFLDTTGFL